MERELNSSIRVKVMQEVAFLPFSILAGSVTLILALTAYISTDGERGLVTFVISLLTFLNLALYKKFKFFTLSSIVFSLLLASLGLYVYYVNLLADFGSFWLAIIPIPTILLLGKYIGSIAVVLFTLGLLPGLLFARELNLTYDRRFTFLLLLSIYVVTLLVYVYERIINHYLDMSQNRNKRLNMTTRHLQEEIRHREDVEKKMRDVLEDVASKNQQLERLTSIDEATINSIGEAVLMVNPQGVTTRANPSSGRVLGVNQEALINQKLAKLLSFKTLKDEEVKDENHLITQSLEHRSIIEETYKVVRPDGSEFYANMTASPLVVQGSVFGAVIVIRDVTQEVNVDQAKTEFVSIASHQLRTPLSTINWYLEMVLSGDFGEVNGEQREFIQEAYDAGQRMGHLIDSLLSVSRIDVGVYAVSPEPLDLAEAINEVLADLELRINKKNIDVEVDIDSEIGKPKYDPRLVNIILTNVISNAVKYTPHKGSVKIKVSKQDACVIEVTDTGYGIPSHQQDKIFTKMFRAENAVEHEPDGTGLGLYIIKSVIEEVGGSISFVSKENEGTTFTVKLPLDGMKEKTGSRELIEGAGV